MKVFIAGVIQGSRRDAAIEDQVYRRQIADVLRSCSRDVEVIEPHSDCMQRFAMDWSGQRQVFLDYIGVAARVDLLVAYLPEASMGTAIEMWEAFRAGVPILVVTPMRHSWAVRTLATRLFGSLEELLVFLSTTPPAGWLAVEPSGEAAR